MSEQTTSAIGRGTGGASPILTLAFFGLLAGFAGAFSFLPNAESVNAVILLLALFAIAGICASFAFAAGLLRFSGHASRNDVTKLICDNNTDGLIVTGAGGKIIYANEAYLTLAGPRRLAEARTSARLVFGAPDISGPIC